jgi:hypothetical protein
MFRRSTRHAAAYRVAVPVHGGGGRVEKNNLAELLYCCSECKVLRKQVLRNQKPRKQVLRKQVLRKQVLRKKVLRKQALGSTC